MYVQHSAFILCNSLDLVFAQWIQDNALRKTSQSWVSMSPLLCLYQLIYPFELYIYQNPALLVFTVCGWEKAEQVESLELHKGVGCGHYAAGHMAEEGNKLTLRRLEAPIHKFIKVALPTDLERLQKHHSNILKVTAETWLDVGSHPKLSCISVCFFPPLNIYSTSIASNGIASIRSILMPAELFRYN